MSAATLPIMHDYHHLISLMKAPDTRERTRAVFASLLANCEDKQRLCSFVLESVAARVNDIFQSEVVHRRDYGLPAIHLTDDLRLIFESEALNDEAHRWLADFLLYPIGKRMRTTRKIARLLAKNKHSGHQLSIENMRLRRHSASTDSYKRFQEVTLLPKSSDSARISRFRTLVDVFHGGYQGALCDENLASRANKVLIDRRWMAMFDDGAFHFRLNGKQIYAVPLWYDATALIPPCTPINRTSILRSRDNSAFKSSIGPDRELISLHALIVQTWYDTGLTERLVEEMHLVDNMPSIKQQVSVLGESFFSQILQHKLALL